jgi:uncharacterized protein (UPF0276 family)
VAVRFPVLDRGGLGVGLDLSWGSSQGFGFDSARGDVLSPAVRAYLRASAGAWSHAFFSWQPRDRAAPRVEDYAPAWDDLCAALPRSLPRALHHTALNLGSLAPYDRTELFAFTNALCERYALRWINEDVGLWSLAGRPVPYPLPPLLTEAGLRATIANVRTCQAALDVPLVLEFPGFGHGVSAVLGDWDAFDHFRCLAEETESPVTLDTGHLLSWRWWCGQRGEALLDDLHRLPLQHCFEIHLSGCEIAGEEFVDAHHGRLLDLQLHLLDRLIPLCSNLRAVTFEDPRLESDGALDASSRASWDALLAITHRWAPSVARPTIAPTKKHEPIEDATPYEHHEELLASALYDVAAADSFELDPGARSAIVHSVRAMVLGRAHRGTGGLQQWFPRTIAAWRLRHADDSDLFDLARFFCASGASRAWREALGAPLGLSLEEALYRFFEDLNVGDAATREEELLSALLRGLAVSPRSRFILPASVRTVPGGHAAVSQQLSLHAAIDGRYLTGPVTPAVAAVLRGDNTALEDPDLEPVRRHLAAMRLWPACSPALAPPLPLFNAPRAVTTGGSHAHEA